jgi:immunity repressor protein
MFDSNTYNLSEEDQQKLRNVLEFVFGDARKQNKRKKDGCAMLNVNVRVKNLVNKYRTGNPFRRVGDLSITKGAKQNGRIPWVRFCFSFCYVLVNKPRL